MTERTSRTSENPSGKEIARHAVATVTEQAKEVTQELSATAREQGQELKQRAAAAAEEGKTEAAELVSALAGALHAAGQSLREQNQQRLGRMGDDVAEQVDRMASYLRDNDMRGMLNDLEEFSRRNPAAFLGITFVGGLLAGRFLRSSRPEGSSGQGTARASAERATMEHERPRPTFQEPRGATSDAGGAAFPRDTSRSASGPSAADLGAARPGGPAMPEPRIAGPSEPWSPGINRPPSTPSHGGE